MIHGWNEEGQDFFWNNEPTDSDKIERKLNNLGKEGWELVDSRTISLSAALKKTLAGFAVAAGAPPEQHFTTHSKMKISKQLGDSPRFSAELADGVPTKSYSRL